MDILILILIMCILIICIINTLKRKSLKTSSAIIGFVSIVLVALIITNYFSQSITIPISNTTLNIILTTDWKDRDMLNQIGFSDLSEGQMVKHMDDDNYLCSIIVKPFLKQRRVNIKYKTYKSMQYLLEERRIGILDIDRIYYITNVTRYYNFIVDDMEVIIIEDSQEGSDLVFNKFIQLIK